ELNESLAIAERLAVHLVHPDVPAHARVGDVQLLVIRRETDAVWSALIVGDLLDLTRLRVDAIDRFLRFLLALEAFVVAANAVRGIGAPDAAVRIDRDVIRRVDSLAVESICVDGR